MLIHEIDVDQLELWLTNKHELLLIDIRSAEEIKQGQIPNAQHIPMHLLPLQLTTLPKDQIIVLYCRSGARSYHACRFLMQQGFSRVINLRGGIVAWINQKLPIIHHSLPGATE
jgi:rhodanese-related sulfurtransferase